VPMNSMRSEAAKTVKQLRTGNKRNTRFGKVSEDGQRKRESDS
jgi:hypothetical protein